MNTNPIIFQVNIDSKLWNEIKEGLFFLFTKAVFLFACPNLHCKDVPYLST